MVFIKVQNLVEIDIVVSIICKFYYFATYGLENAYSVRLCALSEERERVVVQDLLASNVNDNDAC